MRTKVVKEFYDVFDRWVGEKVTTYNVTTHAVTGTDEKYFIYDGNQIVRQVNGSNQTTHAYVWGLGVDMLLADIIPATTPVDSWSVYAAQLHWLLGDNQNTVRDITDIYGDEQQHTVYDSFGNVKGYSDGSNSTLTAPVVDELFGYTGRPTMATKLQWNGGQSTDPKHPDGGRIYDAALGQWLSEDPIGFEARDSNLRRYVGNGPTKYVDPTGLEFGDGPLDPVFDPPRTPPNMPNWDQGYGPLHYTYHSIKFKICSLEEREDLQNDAFDDIIFFRYFDDGYNRVATADAKKDLVYFTSLGDLGVGSRLILNDEPSRVRLTYIPNTSVKAQTLDNHQLVGVRRWDVHVSGKKPDYTVTFTTAAYERPRNFANAAGFAFKGKDFQLGVWRAYLHNFEKGWSGQNIDYMEYGRTLGYVPNPEGPPNQHLPIPPAPFPPHSPFWPYK